MAGRVLILTSEYPPTMWGGIGRYVYEICRFCPKDWVVDVLCVPSYTHNSQKDKVSWSNIIYDNGHRIIEVFDQQYADVFTNVTSNLQMYLKLAKRVADTAAVMLNDSYDILYVQDFYNVGVAKHLLDRCIGLNVVAACHLPLSTRFSYFEKSVGDNFQQALEAALLRIAVRIVVPSEFTKRNISLIYNVSNDEIYVCPFGVRTMEKPEPEEMHGRLRLCSVMRLTDQKGLLYYPKVLDELCKRRIGVDLTVVGRGPRQIQFLESVRRVLGPGDFHHIPEYDQEKVFSVYNKHDIYLSLSAHETFGFAVLEAMACGCVPVAFNVGGLGELIADGKSGFLLCPNDWPHLVDILARLYADPDYRTEIANKCRLHAKQFSWEGHIHQLTHEVWNL